MYTAAHQKEAIKMYCLLFLALMLTTDWRQSERLNCRIAGGAVFTLIAHVKDVHSEGCRHHEFWQPEVG